eukprot:COSAG01_NODE_11754_length_1865_cov_66.575311_3_plen_45_part_00
MRVGDTVVAATDGLFDNVEEKGGEEDVMDIVAEDCALGEDEGEA